MLPKITGLLHNCALNSALPTMLPIIDLLGKKKPNELNVLEAYPVYQSYKQLKRLFAQHYGVDEQALTWNTFANFLNNHSFYANEIILAPVLRKFIGEKCKGTDLELMLPLLCDIQAEGFYENLDYADVAKLFHHQFGISVHTYTPNFNATNPSNPEENYLDMGIQLAVYKYPFGTDNPVVKLFLRNEHFEIQPHESLAEAMAAYNKEERELPLKLGEIHHQVSCSFTANDTNLALGKLNVYVKEKLTIQIDSEARQRKEMLRTNYMVPLTDYFVKGSQFHDNTYLGRQTFAVTLLTMMQEKSSPRAKELLKHLTNLSLIAHMDAPLALYLADELAKAILNCQGNLHSQQICAVVDDIRFNFHVNGLIRTAELKNDTANLSFVNAAEEVIHQAWQFYKKTEDKDLIRVILATQELIHAPTIRNINRYHLLREELSGRSSGQMIGALMLTVIGYALIVAAVLLFTGTFGIPLTAPIFIAGLTGIHAGAGSILAGVSFFGPEKKNLGLGPQMQQVYDNAKISFQPD